MTTALPQNIDFQLGLLYFVHLLGSLHDARQDAAESLKIQLARQPLPESVCQRFQKIVASKSRKEIFQEGLKMLNQCDEEARRSAFFHLYDMARSSDQVQVREAKFLMHSLKAMRISVNEAELKIAS